MRRSDMTPKELAAHDAAIRENDREAKRRWNKTHREYHAQWRAAHREQINAQSRAHTAHVSSQKRRAQAKTTRDREYRETHREQERERGRRYREQHPERVREYRRRFQETHPERHAEQNRRGSRAYRDRNAAQQREASRLAQAAYRATHPDTYRNWYHANLDAQRERGRQASRLRTRLSSLGLPPRRIHRVYAADKRANQVAADQFFTRVPDGDLRRQLAREAEPGRVDRLWRARLRDAVTDQPVAAAMVDRFRDRSAAYRLRALVHEQLPAHIAQLERRRGAQIRTEVRLDAVARNGRRGPPLDIDAEVTRRIRAAAIHQIHQDNPGEVRQSRRAIHDAITRVVDEHWWTTADPGEIREVWGLATIATQDGDTTLAELVDIGTRRHHGLPARHFVAGYVPADLDLLRRHAEQITDASAPTARRALTGGVGL